MPRQDLLDAAIDHVATHGLADLSLRTLAASLGTSHRMLIHHFGSKEGLWVAIVQEVERRQLALLGELVPEPSVPIDEAMRTWWRYISDPALWPTERLFFEVYGQALQGRGPTAGMLEGIVDTWAARAAAIAESYGLPAEEAAAYARLGVAVTRGLLLDLLATGDRAAVDAAMEEWIALSSARAAG